MIGPAVLAFEELLLGDDFADVAAALRARAPGWLLDQLDAAARQVAESADGLADAGMVTGRRHVPIAQVPGWVRLGLLEALLAWSAGYGSTCLHSPDVRHPQPVFAAAWRPGLITCRRCAHLLALPRRSAADRRCDGCSRITAGVEHGDGIWPSLVQLGPLTYALGCCRDCRYPLIPADTAAGDAP